MWDNFRLEDFQENRAILPARNAYSPPFARGDANFLELFSDIPSHAFSINPSILQVPFAKANSFIRLYDSAIDCDKYNHVKKIPKFNYYEQLILGDS